MRLVPDVRNPMIWILLFLGWLFSEEELSYEPSFDEDEEWIIEDF
jgi:hypothetical protein